MTTIRSEITRLIDVVRYSQKKESDNAARAICRLQEKLKEMENK